MLLRVDGSWYSTKEPAHHHLASLDPRSSTLSAVAKRSAALKTAKVLHLFQLKGCCLQMVAIPAAALGLLARSILGCRPEMQARQTFTQTPAALASHRMLRPCLWRLPRSKMTRQERSTAAVEMGVCFPTLPKATWLWCACCWRCTCWSWGLVTDDRMLLLSKFSADYTSLVQLEVRPWHVLYGQ